MNSGAACSAMHAELTLIERAPDGLLIGGVAVVVLGEPEIGRGTGVVAAQIHGRPRGRIGESGHAASSPRLHYRKVAIYVGQTRSFGVIH